MNVMINELQDGSADLVIDYDLTDKDDRSACRLAQLMHEASGGDEADQDGLVALFTIRHNKQAVFHHLGDAIMSLEPPLSEYGVPPDLTVLPEDVANYRGILMRALGDLIHEVGKNHTALAQG